jgi:hypothetical protein
LEPHDFSVVVKELIRRTQMGPSYFVIAILGCADGGGSCTPVATLPRHYASANECSAASAPALEANSNFDFPTLLARCRPAAQRASADNARERRIPGAARRG